VPIFTLNQHDWPSIQILSSDGVTQIPITAPNPNTGWAVLPNGILSQNSGPGFNGLVDTWQMTIDTRILLGQTIMWRPQLIMPIIGQWTLFFNTLVLSGLSSGNSINATSYGGIGTVGGFEGYTSITTYTRPANLVTLPMSPNLSNVCFTGGLNGASNPLTSPYVRPINTADYIGFPANWDYDKSLDQTVGQFA